MFNLKLLDDFAYTSSNVEEYKKKVKYGSFIFDHMPLSKNIFYGTLQQLLNVHLITNYLDHDYSKYIFELLKNIEYNSDDESMIKIYGIKMKIPRKQIAYGEPENEYKFSGTSVKPYDWNKSDNNINSKAGYEIKNINNKVGTIKLYKTVNSFI